jgi:hypothetical protein
VVAVLLLKVTALAAVLAVEPLGQLLERLPAVLAQRDKATKAATGPTTQTLAQVAVVEPVKQDKTGSMPHNQAARVATDLPTQSPAHPWCMQVVAVVAPQSHPEHPVSEVLAVEATQAAQQLQALGKTAQTALAAVVAVVRLTLHTEPTALVATVSSSSGGRYDIRSGVRRTRRSAPCHRR